LPKQIVLQCILIHGTSVPLELVSGYEITNISEKKQDSNFSLPDNIARNLILTCNSDLIGWEFDIDGVVED
jgi:hypothetical protein